MDIEKLIAGLSKEAYGSDVEELLLEAATALSTLQAENEKLRAELKEAEMKIESLLDEEEKVAFYPFGVEKED